MEDCLDTIASPVENSQRLAHKSKVPLKLPGLNIEERHEILFHFVPTHQQSGIFEKFHINIRNGITLYFTN